MDLSALGPKHRSYSRHRERDDFITYLPHFSPARAGGAEKGKRRQAPALTAGLISQQTQPQSTGSPRWGPNAGDTAALSGASGPVFRQETLAGPVTSRLPHRRTSHRRGSSLSRWALDGPADMKVLEGRRGGSSMQPKTLQ